MDLQTIRKLAVIALFSDNEFMDMFVLKGGNALSMVYEINNRATTDIDVSMELDFKPEDIENVRTRLENALNKIFIMNDYQVFDVNLSQRPNLISPQKEGFWGGYRLEFKIIEKNKYKLLKDNLHDLQKNATVIGEDQKKKFKIDISKFEFCRAKKEYELDGYTIYVYTPLMIVYEKLRAICQQMDEYLKIVKTNKKPRAQDFFDIYTILENSVSVPELIDPDNIEILKEMFNLKKVPLKFLGQIEKEREFHRDGFNKVRESIPGSGKLESYDYYFDYVVNTANLLKFLWEE